MYIHTKEIHLAKERNEMLDTRFGIEVEFTGITRRKAAETVEKVLGGSVEHVGTVYDTYTVHALDGRDWKVMKDASVACEKKVQGMVRGAGELYSCELVTPILKYSDDIEKLQEVIRAVRKAGGFTNSTCGIHIHLDGANHTVRSIRNFLNIVYARQDLVYRALKFKPERMRYCGKIETGFMNRLQARNPRTMKELEDVWYEGYFESRERHYHSSRYHFINLHSFFHGHHTVELRGFNSTLHAGEVRSYIVFALALNDMALSQKNASTKKPQIENEKFAMRTWLNRMGLVGDEFKACREHLTKNLSGSSAWRYGRTA